MSVIEISCLEVWREISNYIEDEVDPELRARMDAHFKVCAHCTAVLDGTKNVVKLVADGVEYELPSGFSERLYNKIKNKLKLRDLSCRVRVCFLRPRRAPRIFRPFLVKKPMADLNTQSLTNIGVVDDERNLPISC